jgi:hypothetical protein
MLDGVLTHEPKLAKMCKWAYGQSAPLFLSDGQQVGANSTGCRQGDPLASLFFCSGIHGALIQIRDLVNRRMQEDPSIPADVPHGLMAFMDDIMVFIHRWKHNNGNHNYS